jgi:hypothetical protein
MYDNSGLAIGEDDRLAAGLGSPREGEQRGSAGTAESVLESTACETSPS